MKSDVDALPIDGRSSEHQVTKRDVKEISLRLEPPELPRDHHHHHHNAASTKTPVSAPVASTTTSSSTKKPHVDIVRYEYENLPDGGYRFLYRLHDNPERPTTYFLLYYRYETSDGQTRNEVGYFRDDEKLGKLLNIRGSYTYTGDDGKRRIVRYVADENGYRQDEGEEAPPPQSLPPNLIATLAG